MKFLFLVFITLIATTLKAQKVSDSVVTYIDTVNIHGKVIDEQGAPLKNVTVLSETFDKNNNYIQTKTDQNGSFKLNGIRATDWIRVRMEKMAVEKPLGGSRFLLIRMLPLEARKLNNYPVEFNISAKKISSKSKYLYKRKDSATYKGWHPFGHHKSAEYPGGNRKFYDFIKTYIKYPQKAIQNNIEGMVAVEFTIDTKGDYKDFSVIQDIGYGCSEEVISVIKSSKKWNPAFNGLAVEQRFTIEIPFKLID